jgi:hypothetical protein
MGRIEATNFNYEFATLIHGSPKVVDEMFHKRVLKTKSILLAKYQQIQGQL